MPRTPRLPPAGHPDGEAENTLPARDCDVPNCFRLDFTPFCAAQRVVEVGLPQAVWWWDLALCARGTMSRSTTVWCSSFTRLCRVHAQSICRWQIGTAFGGGASLRYLCRNPPVHWRACRVVNGAVAVPNWRRTLRRDEGHGSDPVARSAMRPVQNVGVLVDAARAGPARHRRRSVLREAVSRYA
jgi:hypothetical protein